MYYKFNLGEIDKYCNILAAGIEAAWIYYELISQNHIPFSYNIRT